MICASCGAEIEVATACPRCDGPALLAERYRLLTVIGRGANGITYRAERTKDARLFAVKEIPLRTLESVKAMELFEREARVLRQLQHPAIPAYEDDFVFGDGKAAAMYLVQELVSGRTLEDEASDTRYDLPRVFAIVAEIAVILDYLHHRAPPVIHRDVKPRNVMRREDGRLALIDFGSVRDAARASGGSTVAGTFGYMAPEQLAGRASAASDIYGLGALAVRLLTGKEPETFLGEANRMDVRGNVDASEAALALLDAMLDPVASKRPTRAADVARRAEALARESTVAKPARAERAEAPKPPPLAKETRRQRKERQRAESGRKETEARARAKRVRVREEKRAERDAALHVPRATPTADDSASVDLGSNTNRRFVALVCALVAIPVVAGVALGIHGKQSKTAAVAASEPAVPELYARPIAVDVNGDGVEDIVFVGAIDAGPRSSEDDGVDTWGIENGHFEPFVQALDGRDGHVLYSIKLGEAYTSLGNDAKSSERIVLFASSARLGVARVPEVGNARVSIHELATGKETKHFTIEESSGRACVHRGSSAAAAKGTFSFDAPGGRPGTLVDLDRMASTPAESACDDVATPDVADVPSNEITNRTVWQTRFSRETSLRSDVGAWNGKPVVASAGLAVFVDDRNPTVRPSTEPTVSFSNGGSTAVGVDNGRIDIVGLDVANGKTRFVRSLASLGLTTQTVDHLEGTDAGSLLFFSDGAGLALVEPTRGDLRWLLALSGGDRIASYTLTKTRAYLHVFGPGNTVFGFLSKKLASRILTVDLERGAIVGAIPGPLPESPARGARAAKESLAPAVFKPVVGCSCNVGSAVGDAGPPLRISLGMTTRSTVQVGSSTRWDVAYALDVGGARFVLPHYDELREVIAPPRSLDGDVLLGVACSRAAIVFVAGRVATAWSLETRAELWTTELAVSRGEAKTTLGGGASLGCTFGRIESGIVSVPHATPGEPAIVLDLASGAALLPVPAGARAAVDATDAGVAKNKTRTQ